LKRIDLCEGELRAQEAGLQPDRFLEKARAFSKSLLLKPNRAEDGVGGGSRLRIGNRQLRLLICLLEPPLLDQQGGLLEGLTRVSA